jgi:hypothetical protein
MYLHYLALLAAQRPPGDRRSRCCNDGIEFINEQAAYAMNVGVRRTPDSARTRAVAGRSLGVLRLLRRMSRLPGHRAAAARGR